MGKGTGFGKTILIGDQFVLDEVPAIVSSIPFETTATVERIDGKGWVLEDNRIEVPGYKEKKKEQQARSIDRILEVMKIDVKKTGIKITYGGSLLAGSGVGASAASCVSLSRVVRGQVLQVREMPFIEPSRALGASTVWIALRHVLPNIASPLIVLLTLNFPSILLLESSLSFLGIGVQPPTASLGRMVGDGRDHLVFAWWVAVAPTAVIVVITFIVQMLGDWLWDVLDVRVDD